MILNWRMKPQAEIRHNIQRGVFADLSQEEEPKPAPKTETFIPADIAQLKAQLNWLQNKVKRLEVKEQTNKPDWK